MPFGESADHRLLFERRVDTLRTVAYPLPHNNDLRYSDEAARLGSTG